MCIAFLALNCAPQLKLLVLFNRDEFVGRPTAALHWWEDRPGVLGGRDLLRQGTWLAVSRAGRFALLTNVREPSPPYLTSGGPSRGALVTDYLDGSQSPRAYLASLQADADAYPGFHLITGDLAAGSVAHFCNRAGAVQRLGAGVVGVSNASALNQWPKVTTGVAELQRLIASSPDLAARQLPWEALLQLLGSTEQCAAEELPATPGWAPALEAQLSSRFICPMELLPGQAYGTRSQAALVVWADGSAEMRERYLEAGAWREAAETFLVEPLAGGCGGAMGGGSDSEKAGRARGAANGTAAAASSTRSISSIS